jgi:hypothetical protein
MARASKGIEIKESRSRAAPGVRVRGAPEAVVPWSYLLAGVLAFTFFFFITSRGELPKYLGVIGL